MNRVLKHRGLYPCMKGVQLSPNIAVSVRNFDKGRKGVQIAEKYALSASIK